ncbi:MAG TPA: UPF0182 family protein [Acidimicrobiales bacterium]|nr:UPF0182 family protein [Acidimicrobiales bacterium]
MPRRRSVAGSNRGRTLLVVVAIALFVLITSLRGIAGFYTDYLWFDSLGYDEVWSGILGAKTSLAAIFVAAFFVVCWVNLYIADRLAPRFPPPGPEQEALDRFRDAIGNRTGLLRVGIALGLALVAGLGMSQEWRSWLLFVNGGDWGRSDAQFGTDIGFYVFKLPFLSSVADWAFASILIVLVVTIAAHFANGGIRVQPVGPGAVGPRVTSQVKAHISVLLGVLALIRAAGYYLQRFELTTSTRGVVDGASYTDVKAQLPVLNLLVLISVASFVLFIVNIWRRGWVLPVLGVGLWGLVAVVAGGIYPQVIQRFQVEPNESSTEEPYIERNIAATRDALGLEVESVDYELNRDADEVDLRDNRNTVRNIRLWDPSPTVLGQTFPRLEELLPYYQLNDVDVDRYVIDDELTQVVLSVRDLNTSGIPASSWEARHVIYTHGYGVVMASGTSKTPEGRPDFFLQQVPVKENTDLELSRPQVYFGEELGGYAITGASRDELDYQIGEDTELTRYEGEDGVGIGSYLRRVAFSLRFGTYDPLITDFITDDSRIHYIRDIRDRVETLAPFLEFDADPYAVVVDGGVKWIVDAYTTTDRFPYAQRAENGGLPSASGLDGRFNYVRNSVKVVVDAYDGTATFYVMDPDDPLIRAWRSAFPDLFVDGDDMPDDVRAHLRYPEDLFRVQTNMWARYHVGNPQTFYNNNDAWNVALDPGTSGAGPATQTTNAAGEVVGPSVGARVDPYYLLTQLPGEDEAEFVMLRSFVPFGRTDDNQQLTAFMVARSDPEHYGELVTYTMPRQNRPDGPAIVADAMQSDPVVSQQQTLLGTGESTVKLGNLIVVPVDESLVYVRPFYVESNSVNIPELKKVIAFFESNVAIADTLEQALTQLLGEVPNLEEVRDEEDREAVDVPDDPGAPLDEDERAGTADQRAARLLEEAEDLFQEARTALQGGDLGEYQSLTEEAEAKVTEALRILAASTTTTTAPAGEGTTTTTAPEEDSEEA